jgi:protein-S-isoprenylcysteine O-methyltransferase Ste14
MDRNTSTQPAGNRGPGNTNLVLRVLLQAVVLLPILAALLFIPAGHVDWVMGWVLLGVYMASLVISTLLVVWRDPSLARERSAVPKGAEAWDKRLINLYNVLTYLVMLPLAGFDEHFRWSPRMPPWVQLAGLVAVVLGEGLFVWAMLSNRYFSAVVRIQEERGHKAISGGPYRYVRHPGYMGMMAIFLGAPWMLGSWWAVIPAICAAGVVVVRTRLEDRELMEQLDGYQDYARQVRHRLLPGVW